MKSTIYMTPTDVISKFGVSLNQKTLLKLDSVKDFCTFFTSGTNTIRISETPVSTSGKPTLMTVSDLEKMFSENKLNEIFDKMKYMINDRQEKINKYNKSNFINKTLYKLSGIISSDAKEVSDPEYVQRGIDYLKDKTIEDIREKIEFIFEKECTEVEQVIAVPKYIELFLSNSYIFIPTKKIMESVTVEGNQNIVEESEIKDNKKFKNQIDTISKIMVKEVSLILSETSKGEKYIRVIFETEDGVFSLDFNDNEEFVLIKNNSNDKAFFNYIEAVDYAILKNNKKIEEMKKEIDLLNSNIDNLEQEKKRNLLELK